ncbi:ArgE/DapE family deacylase [Candidatus Bathyarchaeota archaeon]|nr:ArgE/DapE family deacylase [Candidatus Bathyarchaeota archaeon]
MEEAERLVLEKIDKENMLNFIEELVKTPSYGGRESEAQNLVASKLEELGFTVDKWEIDFNKIKNHPEFSMSLDRQEGLGLVGTIGEGDKRIILCGHVDTVAPGEKEHWNSPPLELVIQDNRVFGRGVADMKGGIACGLYAIKAIQDSGVKLNGKVIFASVIGEEDGGCGALATCLRGYSADAGIIMEPSEAKIAPDVAGAISWKMTIEGRATHACVREEGVSAIEKFLFVYNSLKELEKARNNVSSNDLYSKYSTPFALNVGTITGGDWPGTVPGKVTIEGRLGVSIGETQEDARKEMEEHIKKTAEKDPWLREHPPKIEWVGYSFAPSSVPVDHLIVKILEDSFRKATGKEPTLEGMTYASDARLLVNVGKTPTVVFGPGNVRNAHGPNEYVNVDELVEVAQTLALTILNFLGYE